MRTALTILAGLVISLLLIFFARPISHWIVSNFTRTNLVESTPLASVVQSHGPVFVRKNGDTRFVPVEKNMNFGPRDEVKTERNGRLHIKTPSDYELEFSNESQVIFDLWSDAKKIGYFSLIRGNFRLIRTGQSGQLFILKDGQAFQPEKIPDTLIASKTLVANSPNNLVNSSIAQQNKPEVLPAGAPMPDKIVDESTRSLSSAYIESVFASRGPMFRRCQLSSIRDGDTAVGDILFSMLVKADGSIEKVTVIKSDFKNKGLETCVLDVVERTRFKSFAGEPLQLSYPLRFR